MISERSIGIDSRSILKKNEGYAPEIHLKKKMPVTGR